MRSDRADIGFIGAGQLARMSAAAAIALDVRLAVLASRTDDGAAQVIPDVTIGDHSDPTTVEAFAAHCDDTARSDWSIPISARTVGKTGGHMVATVLLGDAPLSIEAHATRAVSGSRIAGVPFSCSVTFLAVVDRSHVADFVARVGMPLIVKADRVKFATGAASGPWKTCPRLSRCSMSWRIERRPILEERVLLERELAMQVARRPSGNAHLSTGRDRARSMECCVS
ncbi:MAG: hypothetical protein R2855_14050 [Thermomicrobiales bacterium]